MVAARRPLWACMAAVLAAAPVACEVASPRADQSAPSPATPTSVGTPASIATPISLATPTTEASVSRGESASETLRVDSVVPLGQDTAQIVGRVPLVKGDVSLVVQAVTPRGDILVAKSPRTGDLTITRGILRLGSPRSMDRAVTITTPPQRKPQQVTGADVSSRYVVWMETPSTQVSVQPWVLYAYDRRSGMTRQLARSPLIEGRKPPTVPGYTGPVLSGDRVFWAQVSGQGGAERVSVLGCAVDRCSPTVLAWSSAFPVATAEALYVIASPLYAGQKRYRDFQLQRIELDDGKTTTLREVQLEPGQAPTGLAADENHIAWTITDNRTDTINIQDLNTGELTVVKSDSHGLFGFPRMTGRFVVWAESSGVSPADVGGYLYDFDAQQLFSVGNTAGLYSVDGNGRYVVWQDSTSPAARPEDVVHVVARLR